MNAAHERAPPLAGEWTPHFVSVITWPTLAELLDLLTLEQTGDDSFIGHSPAHHAFTRVFGGQLFAQMLIAANNTVWRRQRCSPMHAYFCVLTPTQAHRLQGVAWTRWSQLQQPHGDRESGGRQICNFAASFAIPAQGPEFQEWQPTVPAPDVLPPTPDLEDQYEEVMSYVAGTDAIEFRLRGGIASRDSQSPGRWQQVWFRVNGELPDDRATHSALVAYASDIFLLETTLRPHDVGWLDDVDFATIDYSMWFHRPFRLEGWNLLAFELRWPEAGEDCRTGNSLIRTGSRLRQ